MTEKKEALVCRCEDITIDEIRQCIADGCTTIDEIKHRTRAGMGPCQGRTCRMLIAGELSRALHVPVSEILMPSFRVPAVPTSIEMMAKACWEDNETEED